MADNVDWSGNPWFKNPDGEPAGDGADNADTTDTNTDVGDAADAPDLPDGTSSDDKAKDERGRVKRAVDWMEGQTNRLPPPVAKPFTYVFKFARRFPVTCGCFVAGCGCMTIGVIVAAVAVALILLNGYGPGGSKSRARHPVWVTPSQSANWVPPTAPGEEGQDCLPPKHKVYVGSGTECREEFTPGFASPSPTP